MIGGAPRRRVGRAIRVDPLAGPHCRRRLTATRLVLACVLLASAAPFRASAQAPAPAPAQPAAPPAQPPAPASPPDSALDGQPFLAKTLRLKYYGDSHGLPPTTELESVPIELGVTPDGYYVVPASLERQWITLSQKGDVDKLRGLNTDRIRLRDVKAPAWFYSSALWAIGRQIADELNRRNIVGVYVMPSPEQVDWEAGANYTDRRADKDSLEFVIYTGRVTAVRSFASGDRIPAAQRRDAPQHKWIRDHSPVRPAQGGKSPGAPGGDLLRRDLLDEYVFALDRQPGRHVDVAVSPGSANQPGQPATMPQPGQVNLDYLITETKPWSVYFQLSNTGTRATSEWRERFGFISNQLTGRDDTFTLDYTTAGFADSHDVNVSYDFPVGDSRKLRVRAFANYNQFTASDVGQAGLNFEGKQAGAGAEVALNVFQHRDQFVDLVAGARYEYNTVNNAGAGATGNAGFVVPYGGVRYERVSDVSSVLADLMLVGRLSGAGTDDLNALGRLDADQNAFLLQGDVTHSFFLEPLLRPKEFRELKSTLAHEFVLSGRAQYSFNRLIPAAEEVAGGLYSVRGYPESVSAGDTVLIGSAEYRFHLPRTFAVEPNPERARKFFGQPFRFQPQQVYGHPDWDLILRGFLDIGRTVNVDRESFEHNQTLVGTGVGVELDIKRYVSIRLDGGVALNGVPNEVDRGDARLHFVLTLLY